jgi:hypothetical protein
MVDAATALRNLLQSRGFTDLEAPRGMDYHRRRPQSVQHSSPRQEALVQTGTLTTFEYYAEQLEPEADADHVHQLVLAAMESLRVAMRDVRRTMPKLIRTEGLTYLD